MTHPVVKLQHPVTLDVVQAEAIQLVLEAAEKVIDRSGNLDSRNKLDAALTRAAVTFATDAVHGWPQGDAMMQFRTALDKAGELS